jgi:hypothetical protein
MTKEKIIETKHNMAKKAHFRKERKKEKRVNDARHAFRYLFFASRSNESMF